MKELRQVKLDFSVTEPMASWWSKVPRKPRTRRIGAALLIADPYLAAPKK
jgi:hypothetical protein